MSGRLHEAIVLAHGGEAADAGFALWPSAAFPATSRPMKIVVIHGDARSLLSVRGGLLGRMVELGHEVHALAPLADDETTDGLEALGVEYSTYPLTRGGFTPFADLMTMSHLKQVLFRIKPDLVLSISHKPVTFGSMAAKMAWVSHRKRIYSLVTGLGYPFTLESGVKRRVIYAVTKYFMGGGLGACTGIIFRNDEDREFFRKFGVVPESAITTVIDEPLPENGQAVDPEAMHTSNEALLSFMELG